MLACIWQPPNTPATCKAQGFPLKPATVLQAVRCAASGKGPAVPGAALPAPPTAHSKAGHVSQLLAAKEASGKTFSQIAAEVGLTNVYTTQLFYGQVRCVACCQPYSHTVACCKQAALGWWAGSRATVVSTNLAAIGTHNWNLCGQVSIGLLCAGCRHVICCDPAGVIVLDDMA